MVRSIEQFLSPQDSLAAAVLLRLSDCASHLSAVRYVMSQVGEKHTRVIAIGTRMERDSISARVRAYGLALPVLGTSGRTVAAMQPFGLQRTPIAIFRGPNGFAAIGITPDPSASRKRIAKAVLMVQAGE